MKPLATLLGTFFYIGYLRPASGTWGSAAALPAAYGLALLGGPWLLALAVLGVFCLGWWATSVMVEGRDTHDPSEVVIDEVAGQWVALLPVLVGASHAGVDALALWPGWLVAFLAFRFFDILKPGPIGWADRRADALGVMLDDMIAGLAAALTVMLAAALFHGLIA